MTIRPVSKYDIEKLRYIHSRFYAHEFSFDEFTSNYLCHFAVTDNDNGIISAGGIRSLAEIVLITDKDYSVRDRREALYKILEASVFCCPRTGHDQLHAFIQDDTWLKHLQKVGFRETKGKALVYDCI